MKAKKLKAFTIVELVIVIAVIAILAAVMIPTFSGVIKSANRNTDVQLANTLNKVIAMHTVENKIETESDLRDVINANMGEGYYESLAPKSANYGYHFWYDIAKGEFIVKTVEEIDEMRTASRKGGRMIVRAGEPSDWKESENHFRYYNGYFMTDRAGSGVAEALAKLDTIDGTSGNTYGNVLTTLGCRKNSAKTNLITMTSSPSCVRSPSSAVWKAF